MGSESTRPASSVISRCRSVLGTRHAALLVILVAYAALAASYNLTNPIFEAPDEIWHYLYVRHLAEGRGLPYQQRKTFDVLAQQEAAQPPLYYAVAAALTFWAPRGDVAALAVGNPSAAIGDLWSDGNKNRFLHPSDQAFPWHGEVLTVHLVRFVSTLWGVLAVLLAYAVGRTVFASSSLALATAAIVAFTPQFIFMSSAVSNDVAVAAMAALLVWLVMLATRAPLSWKRSVALGLAGGAVILAKPIAAGCLPLVAVGLGLAGRRTHAPCRAVVAQVAIAALTTASSAGWWFAYNLTTYGSPVPLQSFLGRKSLFNEMPSLQQVIDDLTGLKMSYWAAFGWFSVLAPPEYYHLFDALMVLAAIGWVIWPIRETWKRRRTIGWNTSAPAFSGSASVSPVPGWTGDERAARAPDEPARAAPVLASARQRVGALAHARGAESTPVAPDWLAVTLVTAWVLSVFAALLVYRLIVEAFQGRLAFGATAGIAVLLALGWAGLVPRRFGPGLALSLALTLAVPAALIPWTVLTPAYARPPVVDAAAAQPTHLMNVRFGDEIRLLGMDLSPGDASAHPGDDLSVTLYLQGLRPMQRNETLFLKVLDANGQAIASVDSYPGRGELPTTFWEPGKVVVDRYHLQLPAAAPVPHVDRLIVGLYWRPTMENLRAFDAAGTPVDGAVLLTQLVLRDPPDLARDQGGVVFGRSITLLAEGLDQAVAQPGMTATGYVLYGDLAPMRRNYTIFIHVTGSKGLIAQDDSPPLRGAFPTSFWRPGDLVRHRFHLTLPASTPSGDYPVMTGWYDLKTGQRLTTPRGNAIRIGTLHVNE